ncbi:hypothetical protein ABPG74_018926 [Tetrahymena malaccensis]
MKLSVIVLLALVAITASQTQEPSNCIDFDALIEDCKEKLDVLAKIVQMKKTKLEKPISLLLMNVLLNLKMITKINFKKFQAIDLNAQQKTLMCKLTLENYTPVQVEQAFLLLLSLLLLQLYYYEKIKNFMIFWCFISICLVGLYRIFIKGMKLWNLAQCQINDEKKQHCTAENRCDHYIS